MKTLLRLLRFVLPSFGWVLLSVLLGALTIASGIGLLAASAWIISAAALQPSIAVLQIAIVAVRFFGIARGVFRYLERLISHNTTFRLLGHIRLWLYHAIEPLVPAGLAHQRSGDLLARLVADIESLENFYIRSLAPPLVAVLIILGASLWIGSFVPSLGLVLVGFLLLSGVGLTALSLQLGCRPGSMLVESQAELRTRIVDGIQGLPDLLLYDGLDAYLQQIHLSENKFHCAQRRMTHIASIQSFLATLLTHLCVLVLLVLSIPLVNIGRLDGVFLAVILLGALSAFESVQGLPQAAQYLQANLVAARRLFEIADTTPIVPLGGKALPACSRVGLTVRGLTFAYASGAPVLQDISFELTPGRHVAVVGPSGAGKSTLMSLLLRFWDFHRGRILLNGQDIRCFDPQELRGCFSACMQGSYLFNTSLRENLLLANPRADGAQLQCVLEGVDLADFAASLPQGLDTHVGEHGQQLSGGECQRVALARGLLKDAPLHLFDEPTANLDVHTERRVIAACLRLLQDHSMLWVTHRLVGLEAMDEILVLDAGRLVQRGKHADLVQVDGLYKLMWEFQNRLLLETR